VTEQTGRAAMDERVDERRTNTREQIRTVALEMFAERGYDGTSLREIAEQLGVTKAAVYYHFKTKEDILVSLLEDFLGQVDGLVDWAEAQPPGPGTRRAVVERYAELLSGRASKLARFMQEGQSAIRELAAGLDLRKRFLRLVPLMIGAKPTTETALRAQLALVSLHVGAFGPPHGKGEPAVVLDEDPAERRAAAVRIALELLDRI
jgi:AcrR family transcriptional regulator